MAMQHSLEMLTKCLLLEFGNPNKLFDRDRNRSQGLRKCLGLARMNKTIKLTPDEAGIIAAIDEMRDAEQHWHNYVSEGILYHHLRAAVTLIDDLLQRCLKERLADHLPARVLPISTEPLRDLQVLVDSEFSQVQKLLQPGKRTTPEGKARIRTLLALHSHADPDYDFGEKEVEQVAQEIKAGKSRTEVLPALTDINSVVSGEGLNVNVRISKNEGLEVKYVNDPEQATGIRKVDLRDHFAISFNDLADKVGLSTMRLSALRSHAGIDSDPECRHVWSFGKVQHAGYSQKAIKTLKESLEKVDMTNIWQAHNPMWKGGRDNLCIQPGCAAKKNKR
ncbi:hypothetical protein FBY34_2438 [Streptomyces sp. SLBN-115]|nr:hypothetical protein FBY34_2438 [Streptomyces sp. SLBN-115]